MRGWFPSNRRDRRGKGGPPVDERYLSQNEQSRTSARPLPLEVIENIQEAIWSGISGSVKAVLHRLVDMALADEATDRVGAAWHERTAERRAHRNGTTRGTCRRRWGRSRTCASQGSGCPTAAHLEDGPRSIVTSGGPTSWTG